MTVQLLFENLSAYMLVFGRMGGIIVFNPLLSRKNIPGQVRLALALGMTLLLTPTVGGEMALGMNGFSLVFAMVREIAVGFACGFLFQLFYYMLFMVGDVIDMGFGLSMAKAFDPGTNIQISVSGNLFQMIFILYFFATDSHLTFLRLMASSYDVVSVGAVTFGADVGSFMITLFTSTFSLAMQLALPFIAASFVLEIAMGILMKLVPQINVFSIHFQFKILFGVVLLFLFAEPVAEFTQNYINIMLKSMQSLFRVV